MKRRCPNCQRNKDVDDFGRDEHRPDGCRFWGRRCEHEIRSTLPNRAGILVAQARYRARVAGVRFTLTREWLLPKLENGICERTGLPLCFDIDRGLKHRTNSFSPSLDRFDPRGPYTPKNVAVVCWIYNRAKGAFPDEDFTRMCRAVAARE